MFSDDVIDWIAKVAIEDPRKKSTHAYLNFGKRLLRMITGDTHKLAGKSQSEIDTLRCQGVEDAAFCLVFVVLWRWWLHKHANSQPRPEEIESPYSVNAHFMTRETFLDVILMCQCRILLVKLYREHFSKFRVHADRFSSRFAEYIFQYARMAETNAPLFGVMGFLRHLQHFQLQIEMAASGCVKMPPSRRGVPNDVSRVDVEGWAAPDGWHLTDEEICATLDKQSATDPEDLGEAVWWFAVYLECPEVLSNGYLSDPENFFSKPVKHFGYGDLWGGGIDGIPINEDDNGDDTEGGAGEAPIVATILDHEDEASAASVFGDICRKVELGSQAEGDGPLPNNGDVSGGAESEGDCSTSWHNTPTRRLFQQCCEALKHFNAELTQAAQDRKFRFQTMKMFHSYGTDVNDADKWDYYSDDDDVLLWVEDKYVMANIEEIIEMRQAPSDRNEITKGNAIRNGTSRDRVGANYAPGRVAVLLRLYEEADKSGGALFGYQNAAFKFYSLPRITHNPLDYWLSESILGHVRLQPVQKIGQRKVHRLFN
jgi:hypothetical protein